jgi:hypothetical protein
MMEVENLDQFDREVTFSGCTIITVPGREGFLWIDPLGQLHNAGMNIHVNSGKVQVLVDDVTRRLSYGWHKE